MSRCNTCVRWWSECVWPVILTPLKLCLLAGPSTWPLFSLNLHDFVMLLANVPPTLTMVRSCQWWSRLPVFRRICTVLSPFLNVCRLAVQEWNWILDFWGGGDLKQKCSVVGSWSPLLAASLHAVHGELWAELHFAASCFSPLPWRRFQMCSSLMCYTAPLVVIWQAEETQLTVLFTYFWVEGSRQMQ